MFEKLIAKGIGELIEIVLTSPDKQRMLDRLKFYAAAEAAKIAADEQLKKELG